MLEVAIQFLQKWIERKTVMVRLCRTYIKTKTPCLNLYVMSMCAIENIG